MGNTRTESSTWKTSFESHPRMILDPRQEAVERFGWAEARTFGRHGASHPVNSGISAEEFRAPVGIKQTEVPHDKRVERMKFFYRHRNQKRVNRGSYWWGMKTNLSDETIAKKTFSRQLHQSLAERQGTFLDHQQQGAASTNTLYGVSILAAGGVPPGFGSILQLLLWMGFLLAVLLLIGAGWSFKNHRPEEAKMAILGASVIGGSVSIAQFIFDAWGIAGIAIK